jgi:hypothetical protein
VSQPTPGDGYRLPEPSLASRSIAKSSRNHFNGYLIDDLGSGRKIRTESHLELNVLLVLLMRPNIASVVEQLPPIRYCDAKGTWQTHCFDFLATHRDGTRLAIAVKPWKHARRHDMAGRLACVARYMPEGFADRIQLITERHLDPVDVHNAWLLHGVRHPEPDVDALAVAATAAIEGAVRLQDLVDAIGMAGRGMRALLRLVRAGRLSPVAHERLTHETYVKRVEIH